LNTADNNNANANTNNNNANIVNVMPPGKKKRRRRGTNTVDENQHTNNKTNRGENKCAEKYNHLAQASLASVVLLQVCLFLVLNRSNFNF
jgi:hypothetical protein